MSGWIVYSKDGSIERCKLKSLEYGGTAMGERAVTATFDYHSEVAFEVFDYIEYRGERFELEAVPTVKKLSSFEYQYELRFVSLKYELERCEMRDLSPSDNGVVYPTPLTFSFTGDVRYLTDRIQACLDAMYGADVWEIIIADETSSEEKNITIAQQNCWNALALVNSTYGLNFYIKGRTITIGGEQPLVSHTFEYGKGNGLYEIERASDTETGIVTKLRAYGSTKNLDYSYPKKPEWSDSVLPISFALSPLRLMLPSFKTDGKTDYVLADNAAIAKYGIREASMVYDDIYPSITGAVNSKGEPMDEIKSVDEVDESKSTFVVYLHDLEFDLEEHLTTSDAQISMKSGALQGYTFTISSIEKQTGGYKITLGKNSLENSEESGAYVPGVNWNMKAGDKFVLLNILMPQKYIRDAENRLLARANEYLAQYSKTNFSYNIGLHDKFLIQNPSVYNSLIEGSKLKVYDKEIGINEEVTIQSITITENAEDNILPQVKVTLNNEPSASTLDRIQGKLNEVAAETAANGFSTQSELMAQYRKKLDKPFFEKLFVAVDKDGNDIAANDVVTPIAYIKAKYHFASVGGITMYAMDNDVNIPSLASGLPFDGRTIWYNPDTQQIEVIGGTGGGSGEGVSNFWDLSGIPSWITNSKPKYTYSEIEGTPDLSKYALASQIPSLSGYATESWVLQKNYATKATTLSGYGITDAYTKTNVDDLLKAYVTLSGTQTITGEKNFTGGLKVNGSPIYYDTAKKYWKLEGDLLVTGGVTMYGSDSSFTPSTIMDALLYDDATLGINSNGQLYVKGGTSGGGLDITALQNYLTQNSYLNVTSADNRYLMLSGGTITASNGVYIVNFNSTDGWFCVNSYQINGVNKGDIGYLNDSGRAAIYMFNKKGDAAICVGDDGEIYKGNANNFALHKIWHSGNDGRGSGLDADLLDGQQGSWYQQNALGFARYNYTNNTASERDANAVTDGMLYNYGSTDYWKNTPSGLSYGQILSLSSANDSGLMGQLAWDINNASTSDTTRTLWWRGIQSKDNISYAKWHQIAFTDSNVASATKLQTARTIWGQNFDGTSNLIGTAYIGQNTNGTATIDAFNGKAYYGCDAVANGAITSTTGAYIAIDYNTGFIGVGAPNPEYKLHVFGNMRAYNVSTDSVALSTYCKTIWDNSIAINNANYFNNGASVYGNNNTCYVGDWTMRNMLHWRDGLSASGYVTGYTIGSFRRTLSFGGMFIAVSNTDGLNNIGSAIEIEGNGVVAIYAPTRTSVSNDLLVHGGITMYSDKRKKTILNHVELSLKQIAEAPLIEHYYNSDEKKTTHVGSIAQYWASMNDWFCKKDSEGFLTMEIQNAALASAISIARELVKFENETDKRIRLLEEENKELRNEIERLKAS